MLLLGAASLVIFFTVQLINNDSSKSTEDFSHITSRKLIDKPLQFLSNLLPHIVKKEKPIEFLSDAHIDMHNSGKPSNTLAPTTKDTENIAIKSTDKIPSESKNLRKEKINDKKHQPLQFLDLKDHSKPPASSNSIKFKSDNDEKSARKRKRTKKTSAKKDEYIDIHKEIAFVNPHPFMSPRTGTDISPQHQMTLLKCPKQSTCIVPELQLAKKLKVYLCKHPTKHGVRFYYIAREGLLLHPNVQLVPQEEIAQADFIIYLPGSSPWHLTECTDPSYKSRLIVLDEFDGHQLISPTVTPEQYVASYGGRNKPWYFMYYKRSFVRRLNGEFKRYPHFQQPDVYPMTYAIAEAYIPEHFNLQRDIEILCTLRGTKAMTTRMRTQTWVAEYGTANDIKNIVTSQVRIHIYCLSSHFRKN